MIESMDNVVESVTLIVSGRDYDGGIWTSRYSDGSIGMIFVSDEMDEPLILTTRPEDEREADGNVVLLTDGANSGVMEQLMDLGIVGSVEKVHDHGECSCSMEVGLTC